jgi:multidrug resistance protein MdtO
MTTAAETLAEWPRPVVWLRDFLKEELVPYPGRAALVARIVIAATIVMILTMTFRIPFGAYAATYTLMISREDPRTTVRSAITEVIAFACTVVYTLVGAMLFLNHPVLRVFWVIGTLFLIFYATKTITNYTAAARFGWVIVITIPLWDLHILAETKLEGMLWAVGALTLASVVSVAVELVFAELKSGDDLTRFLAERLAAVKDLLDYYSGESPADEQTEKQITHLAMLGTSRLRRILQRSGYAPRSAEQLGAVVGLVGRLVDIAANMTHLTLKISDEDKKRIRGLAENIAGIRKDLLRGKTPRLINTEIAISPALPLLSEMETTVSLITEAYTVSQSPGAYAAPRPSSGDDRPPTFFVRDALSNPEHIKFALKGCFAASLCYIIYNAVDWPGISTALTTCFVTALSTIGSSHQKQILRIIGALAGCALGLGAQLFVLPHLDSIGDFTLLFGAVTIAAAWIATSGPRLSYVGVQVALAFYIINLQEFKIQTALAPARDRVVGILLGLFVMWVMFDRLWAVPAVVQMRKTFIATLRLLAQFAREPLSKDPRVAIERSYSLRESINKNFADARMLGDGVLFEFGPSREQALSWRSRIIEWQPQLRILFLTRIALWKYRAQLPGFELPDAVRVAQQEFDGELAQKLDGIADRMEGKTPAREGKLEHSLERLEQTIRTRRSEEATGALAAQFQTFLPLCRRIESLTLSLDKEI